MSSNNYVTILSNGINMPRIGMGTYRLRDKETLKTIIENGLKIGYRMIDSAQVYRNENLIGEILEEYFENNKNIKREDIFITTKIAPKNQGLEKSYQSILESLKLLKLDYIDLVLIHWPGSAGLQHNSLKNISLRQETYQSLERLYKEGKVRSIGISNYTIEHINQLLNQCTIPPHVHQFELHPLYYPLDIIQLCQQNNITIQAYSSLGEGALIQKDNPFFKVYLKLIEDNSEIEKLPNYLLKWALNKNFIILPMTKNVNHLKINFEAKDQIIPNKIQTYFDECTKNPTYELNSQKFCWDPETII